MLELLALMLAGIHCSVPLAYYFYAKKKWLPRPWNVKVDENYKPKISIILPTYNEAKLIESKLDDICKQNYPKSLIEIIVVDSASEDGTPNVVKKWMKGKEGIDVKLLVEDERKGKFNALKKALEQISHESEILVFTDADAFWEPNSLKNAVKYFADVTVGSVTASITYENETIENTYRQYFNTLRVAESKIHSVPIHNGPFYAIKVDLIRKIGLPNFLGSDDSAFGSYVAFTGHRSIQVDDVIVKEPVRGSQFRRKIRRAQTALTSFLNTKGYAKKMGLYVKSPFEKIWRIELWLHVINPWLLLSSAILFVADAVHGSIIALMLLGLGFVFLALKPWRTWVLQQLYLILAMLRNVWTKEIMWSK